MAPGDRRKVAILRWSARKATFLRNSPPDGAHPHGVRFKRVPSHGRADSNPGPQTAQVC